jgi:hypothetical protein
MLDVGNFEFYGFSRQRCHFGADGLDQCVHPRLGGEKPLSWGFPLFQGQATSGFLE